MPSVFFIQKSNHSSKNNSDFAVLKGWEVSLTTQQHYFVFYISEQAAKPLKMQNGQKIQEHQRVPFSSGKQKMQRYLQPFDISLFLMGNWLVLSVASSHC